MKKKIRRKGRSKYLVLFFGFVVLYKYVSGRQINILSPVSSLQHVEERNIYLNRALLVLFSITLKLQKKVKERWGLVRIYSHFGIKSLPIKSCCFFLPHVTELHPNRKYKQERENRMTETELLLQLSIPSPTHQTLEPFLYLCCFHHSPTPLFYPPLCKHTHTHTPPTTLIASEIRSTSVSERQRALLVGVAWTEHVGGLQSHPPPALMRALHSRKKKRRRERLKRKSEAGENRDTALQEYAAASDVQSLSATRVGCLSSPTVRYLGG